MNSLYKRLTAIVFCALFAIAAVGCNTMRGAGEDIEEGGEAIQDVADDAQN